MTLSYAPNFGARRYGYYDSYQYTDANGEVHLVEYSPYRTNSTASLDATRRR